MEQETFQQLPSAPFPAPPPFWKHFTKANADRLAAVDASADSQEPDQKLPIDLLYLRPPPPPPATAETYTTFSIPQSLNPAPTAPPPEILLFDPQSPTFNPATLLSRLTSSVLLNFLELANILSNDPMQYEEKMVDVNRIMLNVHFVINTYRPHQAREGVKEMLQARLEGGRKEIELCDVMKEKVEGFLRGVESQKGTTGAITTTEKTVVEVNGAHVNGRKRVGGEEDMRNIWNMIDEDEDEDD